MSKDHLLIPLKQLSSQPCSIISLGHRTQPYTLYSLTSEAHQCHGTSTQPSQGQHCYNISTQPSFLTDKDEISQTDPKLYEPPPSQSVATVTSAYLASCVSSTGHAESNVTFSPSFKDGPHLSTGASENISTLTQSQDLGDYTAVAPSSRVVLGSKLIPSHYKVGDSPPFQPSSIEPSLFTYPLSSSAHGHPGANSSKTRQKMVKGRRGVKKPASFTGETGDGGVGKVKSAVSSLEFGDGNVSPTLSQQRVKAAKVELKLSPEAAREDDDLKTISEPKLCKGLTSSSAAFVDESESADISKRIFAKGTRRIKVSPTVTTSGGGGDLLPNFCGEPNISGKGEWASAITSTSSSALVSDGSSAISHDRIVKKGRRKKK